MAVSLLHFVVLTIYVLVLVETIVSAAVVSFTEKQQNNTIELHKLHLIREGGNFYIKKDNKATETFKIDDIRTHLYKSDCRGLKITQVVSLTKFKGYICDKFEYETMICGGQCKHMTHPSHPKLLSPFKGQCKACGPVDEQVIERDVLCEHVTKRRKRSRIETIQVVQINKCGCGTYKCKGLQDL